jgi:glycerophosphoryl diester phosphodiesterase
MQYVFNVLIPAIAIAGCCGPANAQSYDSASIMQAFRSLNTHNDMTIVIAHRGLWGPWKGGGGLPENSISAISQAAQFPVEAVELDIKLSNDNIPMVIHDFNLGRTTNVGAYLAKGGCVGVFTYGCTPTGSGDYDPYSQPANSPNNPTVDSFPDSTIRSLNLRDWQFNTTNENVSSLEEALAAYKAQQLSFVLTLDVKSIEAAQACATVLRHNTDYLGRPATSFTILKMNAILFTTGADITNYLGSDLYVLPIFTTNMLQKFQTKGIDPNTLISQFSSLPNVVGR